MIFQDKTVLILGSGVSGIGALEALSKVHAKCILFDGNEKLVVMIRKKKRKILRERFQKVVKLRL